MKQALAAYSLALADDELIAGHRLSEWTGHAPILEEDIAFANIALDEIGHSRLWFELAAKTLGEDVDTFPDRQAFFREAKEFRNLQILELPNGDWAFSMLRQYLFDSYELARLEALKNSPTFTENATKIGIEEIYHLRHTEAWMKRLALGTEESKRRTQSALDDLWSYTTQFGDPLPGEKELLPGRQVPLSTEVFEAWQIRVIDFLGTQCQLDLKANENEPSMSRGVHTKHLDLLLEEMQEVARFEPEGRW